MANNRDKKPEISYQKKYILYFIYHQKSAYGLSNNTTNTILIY